MSKAKREVGIVFATDTTPAHVIGSDHTKKPGQNIDPADFKLQLDAINQEIKDIVKLALKVGSVKPGQRLRIKGVDFGRRDVNALTSIVNKRVRQLKKNYVARNLRVKKKRAPSDNKGLSAPAFVTEELKNFLLNANFGKDAKGKAISSHFAEVLENNMFNRTLLTSLASRYSKASGVREVQVDENDKESIHFHADPVMEEYLGPYLEFLETNEQDPANQVTKSGEPRAPFDRADFAHNRFASIFSQGFVGKDDLPAEYVALAKAPESQAALDRIQAVLRDSKAPAAKKVAKKAAKARK